MIIGKPITTMGGGGLKPQIIVSATTGSTVTCDGIQGIEVSGTWTFTVELGTHTIVATNSSATSTKTETVLVDEVALYEITIEFQTRLYLYNLGDECTSVTGGWSTSGWSADRTIYAGVKNSDNMYFAGVNTGRRFLATSNAIDLTNYTKMYVDVDTISVYASAFGAEYGLTTTKTWGEYILTSTTGRTIVEVDISAYGNVYVFFGAAAVTSSKCSVYGVWVE